jgi:hypothetical protein
MKQKMTAINGSVSVGIIVSSVGIAMLNTAKER